MSEEVPAQPSSRSATRQSWTARLGRFATAGLSVAAFCRTEGISTQAFYYWRAKLSATTASPAQLLPVRLLAAPAPVEVVLPAGTVLRVCPGCDLAFLRSLVSALEGHPC